MCTGPSVPYILHRIQRGNVVLVRLNSSDIVTYGVKRCQVELVTVFPVGSTIMTLLLNLTVSDHDQDGGHYLFIEGLAPNQKYSFKLAAVNEAGVSGFTEWTNFTTTSEGTVCIASQICYQNQPLLSPVMHNM